MKLWGGRFRKGENKLMEEFNKSFGFDYVLYKKDIEGSLAHVYMQVQVGLLTEEEGRQITEGLNSILEDIESIVNITFTNNHILFDLGETKIISRLLEGKYVNYLSLLPQEHKLLINVNRQELQNGIERASLMAKEGNSNLVKLEMNEESIIITSNSQLGKVREEVTANMQGDPIQIAFNSRYIIDVLKNMEDDNVQIEMTSSVSPCVIKGKEAESYKYLVLPVRLIR